MRELIGTQVRVELWLDGVPIPLIGDIDFLFGHRIWDLKTTTSMPPLGKARPSNVHQMAVYSEAKRLPADLLYVTDKRCAIIPVTAEQCLAALAELRADAKRLETFLGIVKDPQHALSILPLNTEDRWLSDAEAAAYYAIIGGNNGSHDYHQEDIRERASQAP